MLRVQKREPCAPCIPEFPRVSPTCLRYGIRQLATKFVWAVLHTWHIDTEPGSCYGGAETRIMEQKMPTFPSFYAECAYNDGKRDATAGHYNSVGSFMRHGEPEPVGVHWYSLGRAAA